MLRIVAGMCFSRQGSKRQMDGCPNKGCRLLQGGLQRNNCCVL